MSGARTLVTGSVSVETENQREGDTVTSSVLCCFSEDVVYRIPIVNYRSHLFVWKEEKERVIDKRYSQVLEKGRGRGLVEGYLAVGDVSLEEEGVTGVESLEIGGRCG